MDYSMLWENFNLLYNKSFDSKNFCQIWQSITIFPSFFANFHNFHNSPPLKFGEQMMNKIWVMECSTLLCKRLSGVTLSDRVSLNIAVLVEHA